MAWYVGSAHPFLRPGGFSPDLLLRIFLTRAVTNWYANLGQIAQKQKSKRSRELTISNNGSGFLLSSPCLIREKDSEVHGLGVRPSARRRAWPHVHLLPLLLPWGRHVGAVDSLTTSEETQGQRERERDWPGCIPPTPRTGPPICT